jgi:hypothetical protein
MDPLDTAKFLARGHRGRRRRTVLTAGAAIGGVAVIALTASLLPSLGVAGKQPDVAGDRGPVSMFEPVPGVPRGEAGADQPVTKAEAARRCALRHPEEKRPLLGGDTESGRSVSYDIKTGEKAEVRSCKVPGGDKPSAALVAAAAEDPLPTSAAGQLRNCSVQLWVDLTGWKVMSSDQSKRLGRTILVAVSPSGRKAVACELGPTPPSGREGTSNSMFVTLDSLDHGDPILTPAKGSRHATLLVASGGGSYCPGTPCAKQYSYTGWGRVASNATKIVLQLGPSRVHEIPVNDGWFAITWLSPGNANQTSKPKLTAYDKAGKVVGVITQ